MKKVLTFILVLSMVLGSFGTAFAAPAASSDIAGHQNEEAIQRLNKLGIVEGDDRGFAPDDTITRAEFAVMVVRALGLEGSAKLSKGETQFTDVTVENGYGWATGAINVASKLGYIEGYGDGRFGPAAEIKYEDAVTLIVRVLGYEPAAQDRGGYPVGYLVVADQDLDITDNVTAVSGLAATRGAVFQMLDNALTEPMMIQVGYGTDKEYVVSGTKDTKKQTILTDRLSIAEIEGRVTANFRTDKLKENEIKITDEDGKVEKYEVSKEIDVDALLGLEITAWEDKDDVLFRYEVDTKEDDVLYDTVKSVDEDEVELVVADDEFDWNEDAVVYVNNKKVNAKDFDEIAKDVYGRFVLDKYDEVVFAYLFEFDEDMVGMVLEVKDDEIEFISVDAADEDLIELDAAEEVYVFNADLSVADLDDIEEGTGIFGWVDEDDNFYLVINSEVVEGTLESIRVRDNRITVDGTNISKADLAIYSDDQGDDYFEWTKEKFEDVEEFVDEEVTVVLDLAGKAMVLTTDVNITSTTVYGVATYVTEGRNPVLTVYTNEGKEVEYDFKDRADAKLLDGVKFLDEEFVAVSFKLNKDGEIDKGELKIEDAISEVDKDSDNNYVTVGSKRFYIRENTVVIKALNNSGKLKPSLIKYNDIVDRAIDSEDAIVIGKAGRNANLIVFVDKGFEATDDTQYGVVAGDVARKGGDYVVQIDVVGEGKADYVVAKRDAVVKGDLVEFTLNNKGEVVITKEFNAKDSNIEAKLTKVTDKDGDYLELDGDFKLVDKDTVIYQLNNKGNLDGTTRLSRISADKDTVLYIEDDAVVKVLVVTTKYKEAVEDKDQAKADAVVELIENLPAVAELTLEDADVVEEARKAYEDLTADQKALVEKETVEALEAAEAKIAELKEDENGKDPDPEEITAEEVTLDKSAAPIRLFLNGNLTGGSDYGDYVVVVSVAGSQLGETTVNADGSFSVEFVPNVIGDLAGYTYEVLEANGEVIDSGIAK